jgi:hypothetical protein
LGWFFVAGFFACEMGQLFVALWDCFAMLAMTVNRNDAMCCFGLGAKIVTLRQGSVGAAKNHRSGARGTTQKTEVFFENTASSKLYFRFQKNLGFGLWGINYMDCYFTLLLYT